MLILYFHVFQRGFAVLNATFQASVCVTIVTNCLYIVKNAFSYSRIKTINIFNMYYITQSTIITSPIGFNIGFTNVDTRLEQLCIKVVSTLFQRRAQTLYQRCVTLKIRRRILFHFQRRINIISTLIHNVEMLAGLMHFGFALELSNVDLLNIDLLDTHLDLLYTDIPSKYFACLHNVFKTSLRHVFKTSSRHTFKTSSRHEDVFSVTIFRLPRCIGRRKIVTLKTC